MDDMLCILFMNCDIRFNLPFTDVQLCKKIIYTCVTSYVSQLYRCVCLLLTETITFVCIIQTDIKFYIFFDMVVVVN